MHCIWQALTTSLRQIAIPGLWCLSLAGCTESLPPHEEPQNVLVAALQISSGTFVSRPQSGVIPVHVHITIVNTFSEVLQDSLLLYGSVEIWKATDPSMRAVVPIGFYTRTIPPVTNGILILEPSVNFLILLEWGQYLVNQSTNATVTAWTGVHSKVVQDPYGELYNLFDPVVFSARATVQPFKTMGSLTTDEVQFTAVYHVYH